MAARSLFIPKLHELLSTSTEAGNPSLSWVDSDAGEGTAFQITSHDLDAREALSPAWEFRSLSSFIRQLSYYGFKRLSDRRRSVARRTPTPAKTIVFSHPIDGCFIQGSVADLNKIIRKCRARKGDTSVGIRRRKPSSATQSAKTSRERTPPSPRTSERDELESPVKVEVVDGGERRSLRGNAPLPKRQLSLAEVPRIVEPELRRRGSTGNALHFASVHSAPQPTPSLQPHSHSALPPLSANTPAVPAPRYQNVPEPSTIDYNQYDPQPIPWQNPYPKLYQNSYPQFVQSPYTMEPSSTFSAMYNLGHLLDVELEQQNRFIPYNHADAFDPPSPCDTAESTISPRTEEYDDRHYSHSAQQFDELAQQQFLQQYHSPPRIFAPRPIYDNYSWPQMALV